MDTYYGHVRTPADAIKLFEACRLGLLPRVQRRLSEKERQSIKSGSVFVWDEKEAGMRRWTDGKSWSASRVSGSFLTYREMEGKRGGGNFAAPVPARRVAGKTPDSGRGSDEDNDMDGEGPDGYRYKPDGLMKQSFSITTSTGQHLHLISYYARPSHNAQELPQPTSDPTLRGIVPVKGMYPESTVHEQAQGPAVTRAPMQGGTPYLAHHQSPQSVHYSPMQGNRSYGYQLQPGYSWPPSPVSTPPSYHPVAMYNSPPLPPPSHHGSAHSSPHQYSPMQHGIQLHPLNGHRPTSAAVQQQTAYDRPPPPLTDSSLPPPPPNMGLAAHSLIGHPHAPPGQMPVYAPNPSPRVEQARQVAEQAQQAARLALQQQEYQQRQQHHTQSRGTMPAPAGTIQMAYVNGSNSHPHAQPGRTSTPPHTFAQVLADNRGSAAPTSSPSSMSAVGTSKGMPSQATSSPSAPHDRVPPMASLPSNGAAQSQTMPSISSLVNGDDGRRAGSAETRSNASGSRAGSGSPKSEGPRDIPHEKLNFGEDVRALRVLDRKFCL